MIEAQKMEQRGVHIMGMNGVFSRAIAEIVSRAVDRAPLMPPPLRRCASPINRPFFQVNDRRLLSLNS